MRLVLTPKLVVMDKGIIVSSHMSSFSSYIHALNQPTESIFVFHHSTFFILPKKIIIYIFLFNLIFLSSYIIHPSNFRSSQPSESFGPNAPMSMSSNHPYWVKKILI